MLKRLFSHDLIRPEHLEPSDPRLRVCGVLNPGVAEIAGETVLVLRVAEEPAEQREGHHASPRVEEDGSLTIDWLDAADCDASDPRVYAVGPDGRLRLRFISHLRVIRSADPHAFDPSNATIIWPEGEHEEYGIEDARVTKIGTTWYLTYVAVSRHGVGTMLMSTTNFEHFARHGMIFCPDNKDVVLLPEKVAGSYVALHRPMHAMPFCAPQMWIARSLDLLHWGAHEPLVAGGEAMPNRVGAGTPPILTDAGWLTLYHGSERPEGGRTVGRYVAPALMLDAAAPHRVVGRSAGPVMVPEMPFETAGYVSRVVFPTGMVQRDDRFDVYYGAADTSVAVCGFEKAALIEAALGDPNG